MGREVLLLHLFTHHNKYYAYDTNKNKILSVSKGVFSELQKLKKSGINDYISNDEVNEFKEAVLQLIYKGYFTSNYIKRIEFPFIDYASDILSNNILKVILQVTRDCNFDCRYCSFAGNGTYNRTHEKRKMDFSVGKSAIDFLSERCGDANLVYITFYGGEPFLEFDLIKSCVNYSLDKIKTKDILFNATINASILNDEIICFLENLPFDLLISLDGPEDIHNYNRRFRKTGQGTFSTVMKNIDNLMKNHKKYFDEHVTFNSVILNRNKLYEVEEFFDVKLHIPKTKYKIQYADLTGVDYIGFDNSSFEDIDERNVADLDDINDYNGFCKIIEQNSYFPTVWCHKGPCFTGVQRLFVTCEGNFYPCEKANVKSDILKIGDLKTGFDLAKIKSLLNVCKLSESDCYSCWARRFCDICALKCIDYEKNEISYEVKINECDNVRSKATNYMKKYCERKDSKI